MTASGPLEDGEGIALVEGILDRVGYRPPRPTPSLAVNVDLEELEKALAGFGVPLQQWQLDSLATTRAMDRLAADVRTAAGYPESTPSDPRARALLAKQRQGKGPPSSSSWRGRERNTKYRSQ